MGVQGSVPCQSLWLAGDGVGCEAVREDGVEYLMPVEERWGDICGFPELASQWADQYLPIVREYWSQHKQNAWVKGATICLSSLVASGRYAELEGLLTLQPDTYWHFGQFQAEALARQGRVDEAIQYAQSHRDNQYDTGTFQVDEFCERVLLAAGRRDEAYQRYGLTVTEGTTYIASYRKVLKKYPERDSRQTLLDLIRTRGEKGKWFAAAKDAGHLDIALECARDTWVEPATLVRAARDFAEKEPAFAAHVSFYAIKQLLDGRGYEPTPVDIRNAYRYLVAAADKCGLSEWANSEVEKLIAKGATPGTGLMLKALEDQVDRTRQA